MRKRLCIVLIASVAVGLAAPAARALTDREVVKAIEKGQEWLMSKEGGDGSWPEGNRHGESAMAVFTLVYTGVHPNREVLRRGMDSLLTRNLDCTYAVSMRCMAYAYLQRKLSGQKRDLVRKALKLDAMWLCQAQGSHGGWNYTSLGGSGGRYDFSNTQMAVLALREAALAGCEIPEIVWKRAQKLYFDNQQDDGSWEYQGKDNEGYGSMTAAGLASIFITMDNLNLASGCPCQGGRSQQAGGEFDRRVDRTLVWLEKFFKPNTNPKKGGWPKYWLYSVERVGIAAGYKYFGQHNWFKEGAEHLVKSQNGNGSWGQLYETCFAVLFLYKGRAPIL
ncbi:MAG: prenyltransferase/squalene oxidase repeat-containing protein, partial [Planctomycetota bacterium]|nr:prenyltransferase/squalene oxidase repeat-containing protein [Planctomycetota bacterium]